MNNKVVLITGGSRGVGAATAVRASHEGYDVVIAYASNADAATRVAQAVQAKGRQALAVRCDVGNEIEVVALFQAVDQQFGRLDAVVNNAGTTGRPGRTQDHQAGDMERLLRTNVLGPMLCAREAIKRMSRLNGGAGGAIVNVSSIATRLGGAPAMTHYAASKGAIDAFTLGVAREVAGQGIRVNQISPGVIATDMHPAERLDTMAAMIPMGRVGKADEAAAAILWLLSDEASFVTAANLDVAGGR